MDRADVATCLAVLARLDDADLDEVTRREVERAVADAARGVKKRAKARRDARTRQADRALLAGATRFHTEIPSTVADDAGGTTGDAAARAGAAGVPPAGADERAGRSTLVRARRCYVCKAPYRSVDTDYHLMCPPCATENRARRHARCDLTGRTAVVTGGRVKIGFHTALKLLRDGAEVVVTTRFPRDAARRYAAVPDVDDWADRLYVHGVDLLDLPGTLDFVGLVGRRFTGLDILVNNAAQTLYRPAAYHREVRAGESTALDGSAARIAVGAAPTTDAAAGPPAVLDAFFPAGRVDETGQPLDLREVNSWVLRDVDVSPQEWLQVHVVNAFAPFLLTSRLRPLMTASRHPQRYVVQVSAMEGSFSRVGKTVRHPHTNMAKAALNMLVRTVADDYAASGILMNAVDTGWVTDERPHPSKTAQRDLGFRPPLDVVDGAARVYDPIVRGVTGDPVSGRFLKDYRSVPW
ncbi:SDR family NAD(P)-dependent oxidoreductase [Micromonospora echinofusca]|uniref:SDR family NAD(P)-dependent oxidoreductase n=1 Tax=Micromonospora echinofusca TaxID=47858 RepID=A0ABS3VWB7_MICEH|nr:SDR family NAD(P)-dependent oxidoreductase [Micromonospora echinofusca]MBO4208669.1 SDR family NAD(P)-dependent oxidoreductase [Micromonospora echinofusca]